MGGGLINFHCIASDRQTYSSALIQTIFKKNVFFYYEVIPKIGVKKKKLDYDFPLQNVHLIFFLQCSLLR